MNQTVDQITKSVGANVHPRPKVSVVTPAYNVARYIAETLESAFAQTFVEFEIIVINDGSPDTSELESAIVPFVDRIVYIKQANAGAGVARNTGIEHARGELIAFLDGDDIWLPDYLEKQTDFIAANNLGMAYCDAELFGMKHTLGETFMVKAPSNGAVSVDSLLSLECNVITSGTIVKKDLLVEVGLFENKRVLSEDFHLWVRIARTHSRIGYQKKALLKYRVSFDGLSGDEISRMKRSIDVYRRLENDVELTEAQKRIVRRQISNFETQLYWESGKFHLASTEFRQAFGFFWSAAKKRCTPKTLVVSLLSKVAPAVLLKVFALMKEYRGEMPL